MNLFEFHLKFVGIHEIVAVSDSVVCHPILDDFYEFLAVKFSLEVEILVIIKHIYIQSNLPAHLQHGLEIALEPRAELVHIGIYGFLKQNRCLGGEGRIAGTCRRSHGPVGIGIESLQIEGH